MNIQITGASGSGKTYLGNKLAKKLKYNFVDVDDIIWEWGENIPPYTVSVPKEYALKKLEKILLDNNGTIASGIYYPWAESLINYFDLLVVVETEDKARKKRLIKREYQMYGDRVKKGGDMVDQFNRFLNWAMSYEYFDSASGSRIETNKWIQKFDNKVLYLNGKWPLRKKIRIIQKEIENINNSKTIKSIYKDNLPNKANRYSK